MPPQLLFEKIWNSHVVRRGARRAGAPLHRPPPGPRGHAAQAFEGLRLSGRKRAPARPDPRHGRPQRADRPDRSLPIDRRDRQAADRDADQQLHGVRHQARRHGQPATRASSTSSAPSWASRLPGHDHRLRRQPHRHARRVRRAGLRHRHQRGRARAGHADADADASPRRWKSASTAQLPPGVTAKDVDPRHHRPASASPAATGHAIEYTGEAIRALSMEGPHDGLQHVDRGGRPRRHDRARRQDVRLPARAARTRPKGAEWERALDYWRTLPTDPGASYDRSVMLDARRDGAARHLGHEPRHGACRSPAACPIPPSCADADDRGRPSGRWTTWTCSPARPIAGHRASTACSSAPAPTRASKTCAPRRQVVRGKHGQPDTCTRWSCRARRQVKARPRREGLDKSSATAASTGASRAARCAWA